MAFNDQLFSSLFPAQKIRELEDLSSRGFADLKDDLEGMKIRFEEVAVRNKQLGMMFTALYNLVVEKGVITKEDFKKELDKIDLADWL
ncbi:MAG: hypothetical protein LBC99_05010 [Spirochaetota bacterium]|jgi:hypothetical protein|nr:hypothetical protein [Spirochaetota bacterium]